MSTIATLVTAELFGYLAARTTPEDPILGELRTAADEAGLPPLALPLNRALFCRFCFAWLAHSAYLNLEHSVATALS